MTGLRLYSAAWARVFRQARLCHLAPPKPHNSAPLWGRTPRRTGVTCVTLAALAAALALLPLIPPALANDSEAEIGVGGIVLKQGTPIIMASEDLFLSEDKVRVTTRRRDCLADSARIFNRSLRLNVVKACPPAVAKWKAF